MVMQIRQPDVVDDHPGVVLRAPGLDVGVVEPGVVPRHEVLPLQDLQRLGLGLNLARDKHPHARCHGRHTCRLEKRPSRDPERRAVHHPASPCIAVYGGSASPPRHPGRRYILPRSRHFWKIRCTCASAWLRASSGDTLPVAAWANMVEITQVLKISSMAALA